MVGAVTRGGSGSVVRPLYYLPRSFPGLRKFPSLLLLLLLLSSSVTPLHLSVLRALLDFAFLWSLISAYLRPPSFNTIKMSDLTTSTETTLTTSSFGDVIVERDVVKVRRYRWPELLLSIILLTLFVCGTVVLGSFSYFTYIQQKLSVPIPWFVALA